MIEPDDGRHLMHGRTAELAAIERLLVDTRMGRGAALVVRGHAGIGKTMLLAAARRAAVEAGMTVLTLNGAEAESALPFAGLHQLLAPLLRDLRALTPRLQRTLRGAFGQEPNRPEVFTVGLAVLELLGDLAARTPLLILAEDAHWLDPETLDVLVFVARRLTVEPIAAVMAVRAQHSGVLAGTGLGQLQLGELDDNAAQRVLADHAPGLAPGLHAQVLAQAAGNPLALVELPGLVGPGAEELPELLPLNERLETAFADRFAQLPEPTRAVVAAFSADTGCPLPVLLAAARALTGAEVAAAAIQPAIDAGLLRIEARRLRFRHPLVRSAVYRVVSDFARLTIHSVIADGLAGDPDRRAWHRSAATLGPDEDVSGELAEAAGRALERGALGVAVADLDRAAELTGDLGRRSSLLLQAAELASQLHDRRAVGRLVAKADPAQGDAADRGRLALVRDMVDPGDVRDAGRIDLLCDLALEAHAVGDTAVAAMLCWRAASRCWWASLPSEVGGRVTAVLGKLGFAADEPAALAIAAYAQPDVLGAGVLRQLPALVPDRSDIDGMRFLGGAALILGDFVTASSFMGTAAAGYRAQGRAALLARTLSSTGFIRLWLGRWPAVRADLDEAEALAEETGDHFWVVAARASQALHEAMCGNHEAASRLAGDVLASPGRRYSFGWGTSSRKQTGPALRPDQLAPIDAVLLTHEHHADNLDDRGRELLADVPTVITTRAGARHLVGSTRGLRPWDETRLEAPDRPSIQVTATPCRHGPPLSRPIAGPVIGFALHWASQDHGVFWITGDTVLFPTIRRVPQRMTVDTMLLHLGAVRFPATGRLHYSLTATEAVELCRLVRPRTIIPVHYEGWSHFSQGREAVERAFATAPDGLGDRLHWLPLPQTPSTY